MAAPRSFSRWLCWLLALGLLALLWRSWPLLTQGFHFLFGADEAPRRALIERLGLWRPLALLLGMLLQAALPLLPAAADVVLAARLYGFWGGLSVVYAGTALGAALGYTIGRRFGPSVVSRLAGPRLSAQAQEMARQRGIRAVFTLRLMPIFKAEVVNLVAGALGLPFWPFMAASALGALPASALVVWLSGDAARLLCGTLLMSGLVAALGAWRGRRQRKAAALRVHCALSGDKRPTGEP